MGPDGRGRRRVTAPPASISPSQRHRGFELRPGWLRHPRVTSLPLLPSGPDGVRRPELRRSRPSTPSTPTRPERPDLGGEFDPAVADCRCREPPAPRLARPRRVYRQNGSGRGLVRDDPPRYRTFVRPSP